MIKMLITGYSVGSDAQCQVKACILHEPARDGHALQGGQPEMFRFALILMQILVIKYLAHTLLGIT